MKNDSYGRITKLTMEKIKEDTDDILKETEKGVKDFEYAKKVIENFYYTFCNKEKRKMYTDKIHSLKIQFDQVEFWDFFKEERNSKAQRALEKFGEVKKISYMFAPDIQAKIKEAYERLSGIENLSYTKDLNRVGNFYEEKYMRNYEEYSFKIKSLFEKFIERYSQEDLLRDCKEKELEKFHMQMNPLKSSTDFEKEKRNLIDNNAFLEKYVAAKFEGGISERMVRNWLTSSSKDQIEINRSHLLQLAFVLKLTKEELNDALKKMGHRELYLLDDDLLEIFIYKALEYNKYHRQDVISYQDVVKLAEYGQSLLAEYEIKDEFILDLSKKNRFSKSFIQTLDKTIQILKSRIETIKSNLGIVVREEEQVQQALTNILTEESDQINEHLISTEDFDGTEAWVRQFINKFSGLYQYQYISRKITIYQLYEMSLERRTELEEYEEEIEYQKRVKGLFLNYRKTKQLNRDAAIRLILLSYLSELDQVTMNENLGYFHFGPLNARRKKDLILICYLRYIRLTKTSDTYAIKFLKIINWY